MSAAQRGLLLLAEFEKPDIDEAAIVQLIQGGASLRQKDGMDNTALALACYYGMEAVALLLIEEGAAVNARNAEGRTPLMEAAHAELVTVVHRLLAKGAQVNRVDEYDNSALSEACNRSNRGLALLLLEAGAAPVACPGLPDLAPVMAIHNKQERRAVANGMLYGGIAAGAAGGSRSRRQQRNQRKTRKQK